MQDQKTVLNSLPMIPKSKPAPKSEPTAAISCEQKWPKDFFVCEVADGFAKIQQLKKEDKKEKDTFSNVFLGVKYTKSTVWKYKKIWQSAKPSLRDEYIQCGPSTSATFSNFLSVLNGKHNSDSSSSSESDDEETAIISSDANMIIHGALAKNGVNHELQGSKTDGATFENMDFGDARLCPFCDQPIKTMPSPTLASMLNDLLKKTWSDPLPDNPGHRKAQSFTVFASFCECHRFEDIHVPHAISQGWLMEINFSQLFDRVIGLEDALHEILADPESSSFFQLAKKYYRSTQRNEWSKFSEQGAG